MSPPRKSRPGTDRRRPGRDGSSERRRGLRALLSVADKDGIVPFAQGLAAASYEIVSTGGTAKALRAAGIPVVEVATITGFPEIMDGRVKTLHPHIHGGLLARRGVDEAVLIEHGIDMIDVVAVNLYPFEATAARPDCTDAEAIENIDIGGPAMLRAAAKNHERITVVVDPADYSAVLAALNEPDVPAGLRRELAIKAFGHTARYDTAISNYLRTHNASPAPWPDPLLASWRLAEALRYGENPHQQAALYRTSQPRPGTVAHATQIQGKELSFNNIVDADAAFQAVNAFEGAACVIVKHANPCGVAVAATPALAYAQAYRTDPTSAFGGVIAFNRPLDQAAAEAIVGQQFAEVIVAPEIGKSALAPLAKKPNIRALAGGLARSRIGRGARSQDDRRRPPAAEPGHGPRGSRGSESGDAPRADRRGATRSAVRMDVVKFVKSNAIVYAHDGATIGIGAGQPSRVMSARIGAIKAGEAGLAIEGAVLASDAFFPFRDGIDAAAEPVCARSCSRADRCATTRWCGPPTSTASRWCSPACVTSGIEDRRSEGPGIGGGGREHALAWKCAQSPLVERGARGARQRGHRARSEGAQRRDRGRRSRRARRRWRGGSASASRSSGPRSRSSRESSTVSSARASVLRADAAGAQLEGSKAFTKEFLARHGIPTAAYRDVHATSRARAPTSDAHAADRDQGGRARRGQGRRRSRRRSRTPSDARAACSSGAVRRGRREGRGRGVHRRRGGELHRLVRRHARRAAREPAGPQARGDGDAGPNTGGMGAYSPAPVVTAACTARDARHDLPDRRGLRRDGIRYRGLLYAGLMITRRDARRSRVQLPLRRPRDAADSVAPEDPTSCASARAAFDGTLDDVEPIDWDPRATVGVVMASRGYPDATTRASGSRGSSASRATTWRSSTPARASRTARWSPTAAACCARWRWATRSPPRATKPTMP